MGLNIKHVNDAVREYLTLLACKEIPGQSYSQLHSTMKQFQNILIEKYSMTLDYHFCDTSIHQCWDTRLQDDIESYQLLALIDEDHHFDNGAVCNPKLNIGSYGNYFLNLIGKQTLENVFKKKGIMNDLSKELKSVKQKCS